MKRRCLACDQTYFPEWADNRFCPRCRHQQKCQEMARREPSPLRALGRQNNRIPDMTGRTFGELTVTDLADVKPTNKRRTRQWLCTCSCGAYVLADGAALRTGNTKSCGCLRKKQSTLNARLVPRTIDGKFRRLPTGARLKREKGGPGWAAP